MEIDQVFDYMQVLIKDVSVEAGYISNELAVVACKDLVLSHEDYLKLVELQEGSQEGFDSGDSGDWSPIEDLDEDREDLGDWHSIDEGDSGSWGDDDWDTFDENEEDSEEEEVDVSKAKAFYDEHADFFNNLSYPECDMFKTIDLSYKKGLVEAYFSLESDQPHSEADREYYIAQLEMYHVPLAQLGHEYAVMACKELVMSYEHRSQLIAY